MNPPDSPWVPGDSVLVINGSERGRVGVIVAPSAFSFDGMRCWTLRFHGELRMPAIREDFLVAVPTESDEDVLGPLRKVTCP